MIARLVAALRARGVDLATDGTDLVICPAEAVRPDEVDALREHKAEVLAMLTNDPLSGWPATVPRLGQRVVVAFTLCADCESDPPPDEVLNIGGYTLSVPRPRGTFVTYRDTALCRKHARRRCESAP